MVLESAIESQLGSIITKGDTVGATRKLTISLATTIASILVTSLLAWVLVYAGFPSPETLSVLFVIPVLAAAVLYGLRASLIAVVFSVLAYNFVLLPPVWHIGLFEAENFAKAGVLTIVAFVASALSLRVRKLAQEAMQRERILSGVYALSQDMLGIANIPDMRHAAENKLSSLLGSEVIITLMSEKEKLDQAAKFCLENNTPAGAGTKHSTDSKNLYLPLAAKDSVVGVLCIAPDTTQRFSSKVLATLAAQAASALEKARLAEADAKKQRDAEREKFLSALLSSVSHDFKTPLVTVIGAFSSLKEMKQVQDNFDSREMVAGGLEEAQKLNRFINNLVEISRLESGLEEIRKEPVVLRDILASSLKSLHPLIGKQRFSIQAPQDFPILKVNSALMELVFLNLLENAIKYGPADGEVKVIASFDANGATIDIDDDGEGIPESEREAIFVKFYRSRHGDRKIAGTGLGLYICRGIVEAHGGSISAIDPHDGKGACVRIHLPPSALIPIDIEQETEEV
ncbi:MAG: ATP-binding protein [Alphaproteobacteria bacterium]|nr:ATP-binding protein [Alphaproteobacteria bacterium]